MTFLKFSIAIIQQNLRPLSIFLYMIQACNKNMELKKKKLSCLVYNQI